LTLSIGDGFKFGCGLILAIVFTLASLVLVAAIGTLIWSALGAPALPQLG
jgi:hypothetical protein